MRGNRKRRSGSRRHKLRRTLKNEKRKTKKRPLRIGKSKAVKLYTAKIKT